MTVMIIVGILVALRLIISGVAWWDRRVSPCTCRRPLCRKHPRRKQRRF